MKNEINSFFEKFLASNRNIFEELKSTIKTEQISLVKNIDYLKKNVNNYITQEA